MRTTLTCPKCDNEEILFVPRLTDFQHSTLAAHVEDTWSTTGQVTIKGALQAYTCRRCGYTEIYMNAPAEVDPADIPGAKVLKKVSHGPFR